MIKLSKVRIDLIKHLEETFFETTFEKIKKNLRLKDLNLSDQEIIDNKKVIKTIINLDKTCSHGPGFCAEIKPHKKIIRNKIDNELTTITYKCLKIKHFELIDIELMDKHINEYLISKSYKFNTQQAKESVYKIKKTKSKLKNTYFHKKIMKIGDPNLEIKNLYIFVTLEEKKNVAISLSFLLALKEEKTLLISSDNLRNALNKYEFNFEKEETTINDYGRLTSIKNLIIVDLGYEEEINKLNYYLSWLPNLIKDRHDKNLTTIFISCLSIEEIIVGLKQNSKYKVKKNVNDLMLEELKTIFQDFFTANA